MPSKIGQYTCSKTLGRGVTAVVKKAVCPEGKEYAIKIFENVDAVLLKALRAEVETLINIQLNNIVNCKEFNEDGIWEKSDGSKKKIMYIVMELISGGELFDYIATGGPLPEPICRYYFRQMLSAMHGLHSRGTSHRDLKPENILIDENYNMRIADFGFAAPMEGRDGSGQLRTMLGTESYMAPEIHDRQPYSGPAVDLFAAGIVLFIMVAGSPPFGVAVPKDRFYKFICANRCDMFWRSHSRNKKTPFSENFINLLNNMFQQTPGHRL
jgi:serine/threonine protein kinase